MIKHPEIKMPYYEVHHLQNHEVGSLVKELYDLPEGDYLRGYKAPRELNMDREYVMEYYRKYWPNTKLIVGVRHPVLCK